MKFSNENHWIFRKNLVRNYSPVKLEDLRNPLKDLFLKSEKHDQNSIQPHTLVNYFKWQYNYFSLAPHNFSINYLVNRILKVNIESPSRQWISEHYSLNQYLLLLLRHYFCQSFLVTSLPSVEASPYFIKSLHNFESSTTRSFVQFL